MAETPKVLNDLVHNIITWADCMGKYQNVEEKAEEKTEEDKS